MSKKSFLVGTVLAGALFCMTVAPTFAAGNGYAPAPVQTSAAATAAFQTVLTAQTFSAQGGTETASVNGTNASLRVPANAFNGSQVTLTSGNATALSSVVPSGDSVVANIGVNFEGVPNQPITLTIKNANIPADAKVYKVQNGSLIPVQATVTNGQAVITFQNDPDFVVLKSTGTVQGATSPKTGVDEIAPLAEGAVAMLAGAGLIVFARRKKN